MSTRRRSARLVRQRSPSGDVDDSASRDRKRKSTGKTRSIKQESVVATISVKEEPGSSFDAPQAPSMVSTVCVVSQRTNIELQEQFDHPDTKPDVKVLEAVVSTSTQASITEAGPSQAAPEGSKTKLQAQGKPRVTDPKTGERRAARFRSSCSGQTRDRFKRVMSQRMFLLDREKSDEPSEVFKVVSSLHETPAQKLTCPLGSTGNVYTITIGLIQYCDCPDASKGHVPCKHILFVMLKVLKVPEHSYFWYQKALVPSELQDIFSAAPPSPRASLGVPTSVKNHYYTAIGAEHKIAEGSGTSQGERNENEKGPRKVVSVGEDCPICYEEMTEKDDARGKLVYDESLAGCGKGLHRQCFNMWAATAKAKQNDITCVWCRAPWVESAPLSNPNQGSSTGRSKLGYLNLADVAGINRQRDTSSYYHGPILGRPLWETEYRYLDD